MIDLLRNKGSKRPLLVRIVIELEEEAMKLILDNKFLDTLSEVMIPLVSKHAILF
jgi:hypothetical protein